MDDEIIVTVKEGETPPIAEPVVVVVETAPVVEPVSGDSAVVVFSMEQLAERITELEAAHATDVEVAAAHSSEIDRLRERLYALEIQEVEEVADEVVSKLVAETIVDEAPVVVAEVQPSARRRRFV